MKCALDSAVVDQGKTVLFLIGSGVVKNAWAPVKAAVNETRVDNGFLILPNQQIAEDDTVNFVMAKLVYLTRWMWRQANFHETSKPEQAEQSSNVAHTLCAYLTLLRENIAKNLIAAQNLEVRPQFRAVIQEGLKGMNQANFLTTNWDQTIEKALLKINPEYQCQYLHGNIAKPQTLYLPSETVNEPYRDDETHQAGLDAHKRFQALLIGATRLVLYGLSLSPLDADLAVLLNSDASRQLKEIFIVDPQAPRVRERLSTLLSFEDRLVRCFIPETFD